LEWPKEDGGRGGGRNTRGKVEIECNTNRGGVGRRQNIDDSKIRIRIYQGLSRRKTQNDSKGEELSRKREEKKKEERSGGVRNTSKQPPKKPRVEMYRKLKCSLTKKKKLLVGVSQADSKKGKENEENPVRTPMGRKKNTQAHDF